MAILAESFNIKNGKFKKNDGSLVNIAYIDPQTSENTYQHKDVLKDRFHATWIGKLKAWGWFVGNDDTVYRRYIGPCLEWLRSVSKNDDNIDNRSIVEIVDSLISEIQTSGASEVSAAQTGHKPILGSAKDVEAKLKDFKERLVNALSAEDFKRLIEPVIRFKRAQGYQYSWGNSILIWIQDPEARMVKSRTRWKRMNREVLPDAPAIWMWVPKGERTYNDEEKKEVTQRYLKKKKKNSVKDLYPGEKDELFVLLKRTVPSSFELMPYFFDYRFTKQMEGKEDLIGDPNTDEIPWFDNSNEETDETKRYIEAMREVIESSGIQIDYKDDLGGARGVSMSGSIDLLKDAKKNAGMLNTMIHEFSHEVLHQTYLKSKNDEFRSYFVGTEDGRGKVEQQAELCAWIVMQFLGYDMPTSINYVGIWGMDKDNAIEVFNSVSNLANKIWSMIMEVVGENAESVNESVSKISRMKAGKLDGRELAYLVGCGEVYDKAMEDMEKKVEELRENFDAIYSRFFGNR